MSNPGSYLAIRKVWRDGDTVSVSLPMTLRQEPLAGDDSVNAVLYGPLALAANLGAGPTDVPSTVIHSGDTSPKNLPWPDPLPEPAASAGAGPDQWIEVESRQDMRFKASCERREVRPDADVPDS